MQKQAIHRLIAVALVVILLPSCGESERDRYLLTTATVPGGAIAYLFDTEEEKLWLITAAKATEVELP